MTIIFFFYYTCIVLETKDHRTQVAKRPFSPDESKAEIGLPQSLTSQESHRLARQMLGALDAAQRRVIELVYFEGLSMKDVAERTGDSFASVRHRYYRGISKMRALMRQKNSRDPMPAAQETFDVQT